MPSHYKFRDYQFAQRIMALRKKAGLTQEEIAIQVGVSEKAFRNWEGGIHYPSGTNLQKLIKIYLLQKVFTSGQEQVEAKALWELSGLSTSHHLTFDEGEFRLLLENQDLLSGSTGQANGGEEATALIPLEDRWPARTSTIQQAVSSAEVSSPQHREDWGEALDVYGFAGRERELAALERWVLSDQCRLVVLLGMGGIGKTALSTKFAQHVAAQFDVVFWRSLHNAPGLEEILNDCLQLLVDQRSTSLPPGLDQRLSLLIEGLRARRCLLVLDNVETILQGGETAGHYRQGYEDYRKLLLRVGGSVHRSCLLLASREKLAELDLLVGTEAPVHVLRMTGLAWTASQALLEDKRLFGEPQAWHELSKRYAGNPLALKIVTGEVRELFGGDIAAFLREGHITFQGIRELLTQQVERLSAREQELLYWLAIERDLTSLEGLRADMVQAMPTEEMLEALSSLRYRNLIERGERGAVFTLQPVVLEYVTGRLVEQVCNEILTLRPVLLLRYALLQAQAKDYIRSSQGQLVLQALLNRLLSHLRDKYRVEQCLDLLIQRLRALPRAEQGYGGGNVVNLLVRLHGHLKGKDCSHLTIWQADLQGAEAHDANFSGSDLTGSVFLEPIDSILSVALSADGQYVAGGSNKGEIRLWRALDGQLLLALQGHGRQVLSLVFHPDGTRLISGGYDGLVKVWEISSGRCLSALQGHTQWVRALAIHPEGRLLATGSDDGSIRLWDLTAGQCIKVWHEQQSKVWSVAFSPDGSLLAGGHADGVVQLWELASTQSLWAITAHRGSGAFRAHGALSVVFSPDGELLVSGGEDARIMVWQTNSGEHLSTLSGHTDLIYSVTFNAEGLLASGSFDGTVKLWKVGGRGGATQCLGTLQECSSWIWSTAFGPEGLLATGSQDGVVKLWQVNRAGGGGKCLRSLRGYSPLIEKVALSPDGGVLANGEHDGTVRMWKTQSGQCLYILSRQGGESYAQVFSPDGRLFARSSSDNTIDDTVIQIWEVDRGQRLRTLKEQGYIWSVVFSPDGRFLASGSADTTIKRWEVSSGQCLTTFEGHSSWVWSVAYSPDGTLLASGDFTGVVKIWEISSGQCLRTLHGSPKAIVALVFTPDGQTLLSSNTQDLVTTWDVQSGDRLKTIPGIGDTYWLGSVAFCTDGSLLAATSADQTVKVWDVSSGQLLGTFPIHVGRPWSVAWSADQRLLACGTDEGTIMLWERLTGKCLMTLRSDRPYERMNISGVTGITDVQKAMLKTLGAIQQEDTFSNQSLA